MTEYFHGAAKFRPKDRDKNIAIGNSKVSVDLSLWAFGVEAGGRIRLPATGVDHEVVGTTQ
jgi:hypothetical protein